MSEFHRMTSTDRVACRCPDGRHGGGIERVRAFIEKLPETGSGYAEMVDSGWAGHATFHGPGTDCASDRGAPTVNSYEEVWAPTREAAEAWLRKVCGRGGNDGTA